MAQRYIKLVPEASFIPSLNKTVEEFNKYKDKTLYHLAIQTLKIVLDDGVLLNFPEFDSALKKIVGDWKQAGSMYNINCF